MLNPAMLNPPALLRRRSVGVTGPELSDLKVFYIGHSLQNFEMPQMVQRHANATTGISLDRDVEVGVGAPLALHISNPPAPGAGFDVQAQLAAEAYDAVILCEATPTENHAANTVRDMLILANIARAQNAVVQIYLYETWEGNASGFTVWRATVNERRYYFEKHITEFRAQYAGSVDVLLIPAAQALGALVDAINASAVPDVANTAVVFADTAGHLTDVGNWFISCVQFATLWRRTPVGLERALLDVADAAYIAPSAAAAAAMQAIAWDVVRAEPYSDVPAVAGVPTILSMVPASLSTTAEPDAAIVVTFSEPMNPATIYAETMPVTVAGVVVGASYSLASDVLTITPSTDLAGETLHTVTVTPAIQDLAGVNMAAHRALGFITAEDVLPPELNTTQPTQGQVGANRFVGVTVYYFNNIDASTVDATTFLVTTTSDGQAVAGSRSVSGGSISFTPSSNLAATTEYRVVLTAGVEGEAPRGPIVPLDYVFTTA